MNAQTETATDAIPQQLSRRASILVTIPEKVTPQYTRPGAEIAVSVATYKPGPEATAQSEGGEVFTGKTVPTAVTALVSDYLGETAKKGTDFNYDTPDWQGVENAPTISDADQKSIDAIGAKVAKLITSATKSKEAARAATFEIADALLEAKELHGPSSNAAWGKFVRKAVPISFAGKNAVSELMDIGRTVMPSKRDRVPDDKASARAILNWTKEAKTFMFGAMAERVLSAVASNDKVLAGVQGAEDVAAAYATLNVPNLLVMIGEHLAEFSEIGETSFASGFVTDESGKLLNSAEKERQLEIACGVVADTVIAADGGVESIEADKGYRAAVKAELFKTYFVVAKTSKEEAQDDADKFDDEKNPVTVGFEQYTAAEAAEHLAKIASVRDDFAEILKDAIGRVESVREARKLAAMAADQAAADPK